MVKTEELQDAVNVRLSRNDVAYDTATLVNTPSVMMYDQTSNPFSTDLIQGPNCVNGYTDPETYEWICTEYEMIPNFDSTTLARGNATNTTTYADAPNLTGAISYDSTYDITGNTRTTITNCCQQISFNYSTATQYSQPDSHKKGSATDATYQMTESATYDFNTGAMKTATDFNGRVTAVSYDSITRPIQTTFSTGGKTTTEYFDSTLSIKQTTMEANNNIVSQGQSYFNGRGQTVNSQSLAGTNWNAVATKYDMMGRQSQSSRPYNASGSPTSWTTYIYDNLSRVKQVTAPDGSTSKTFYNETSRPSSASNALGQTVRSQDAWGRERWARTDDFGRLVEVVEAAPNGNGGIFEAGSLVTNYSYSPKDELLQVNQGEQVRAFKYDSLGRLTRQKLAEQTATISDAGVYVGNGLWSDAFVYDARSNLVQRTDARGVKTNFNYTLSGNPDPLNRLQSISYDKSTADTSKPIWDAATVTLAYLTSGDKTRVSTVTVAGISTELNTYDIEGRVSEYTMTLTSRPSHPMVLSYLYDTTSRLTEIRYPAQYGMTGSPRKTVNPSYDNASRLTQMTVNGAIQMNEIVYNPLSQVTQLKTGAATGNADVEQYSYDPQTGFLTNQKVLKANNNVTLLDLSYNYNRGNSKGNLNGKTGQLTNIVNNLDRNKDRVYEFDTLGRLITAKGGGATGVTGVTANWTQNYSFDRYGNRTSVTASGITANNQAVPTDGLPGLAYQNASNRINTIGYEYDLTGSQTRGQSPTGTWQRFEYDSAGRLVKIKADDNVTVLEEYVYGAGRQRLKNVTAAQTTYYAWGGSSVLCEYAENSSSPISPVFSKSYIYAGSRLLSTQTNKNGTEITEFHHPDRLGTKLITNNQANTLYEQATLPFGTALNAESSGFSNQVFTSYDRSSATGLDYANNRSYSSGQSRFTTVDPAQDGLNLYAYVGNNPIDFVDPSGLNLKAVEDCHYELVTFWVDGQFDSAEFQKVCNTRYVFDNGGEPLGGGGTTDPPAQSTCGVNPVTTTPGFNREPRGLPGNLRPGVGGRGEFGAPRTNKSGKHSGLDISAVSEQTPIYSFYPGKVSSVTSGGAYGNKVTVNHGNGYVSSYSHLSSVNANTKSRNVAGEFTSNDFGIIVNQLGVAGMTGNAKKLNLLEAHVHFEIRKDGKLLDPEKFLNSPCPKDLTTTPPLENGKTGAK